MSAASIFRFMSRSRALLGVTGLVLAGAVGAGTALAKAVPTEHVEAELVAQRTAVEPGKPLSLGLRLKMDAQWHTYWRNPGDTGLPTTLQWQLPEGVQAGDIAWPAPQRIDVGPFANYGYENEILLPVTLSVPAGMAPGAAFPIKARAEWLVCREQCIPGGADLELELTTAAASEPDARWSTLFAKADADAPRAAADRQWSAHRSGGRLDLIWTPPAGSAAPSKVQFFPYPEGIIEPAARQALYRLPDGRIRLSLALSKQITQMPQRIDGVITSTSEWGGAIDKGARAVQVSANVGEGLPAAAAGGTALDSDITFATGGQAGMGLATAIALALLGGLILNLMPCVFPVISLKLLGFVQQAHGEPALIRRHGLIFAAGVMVSFIALAAVVLGFRAGGEQLGWGFQLQSPIVITALAILFFLLTLNLAGFFEVGMFVPGSVATLEAGNPYANSFLSGVLAVVIASPCTAPFMGAALGFALAQPAIEALAVFGALGLGMALPYLLLACFPAWLQRLPRPGLWMVKLKQLLAIPLAATVIWLGWVLAQQSGIDAFARLLFVLLLLSVAIFFARSAVSGRRTNQILAIATLAIAGWIALPLIETAPEAGAKAATGAADWQPYSRSRLDELVSAGRPVFVDFTAAWCVSCQANKKLVLERDDTLKAFAERKVVLLRADWTRRDPEITAALADFGRSGVPVYALYRPGKSTLVLPEILTLGGLRDALHSF